MHNILKSTQRQRGVARAFACMSQCVLKGRRSRVQVFHFLPFPSLCTFSLVALRNEAPLSCSFVLSCFSFRAHSLSSPPPNPFFPSSSFLHLLRSLILPTQSKHMSARTHSGWNIHSTSCLCLRKHSWPAYQRVEPPARPDPSSRKELIATEPSSRKRWTWLTSAAARVRLSDLADTFTCLPLC